MKCPGMAGGRLLVLALALAAGPLAAGFQDPSEVPAQASSLAAKSPMTAVATAGRRLVAVGQRGHVVFSDDGGNSWTQAQVPVSSDLLAVHFPSPELGWAVGHGGVVIHSADGGKSWTRQLDGKSASQLIVDYYDRTAADGSLAQAGEYATREKNVVAMGGTQPFLGVYFEDGQRGYVAGTFNRILRTEDGGKTWVPQMHKVDNPRELNFFSIGAGASGLFLVGETGSVWKYDPGSDRFVAGNVGYHGTLFGIAVGGKVLVAHGMRGSVFRSADAGKTWQRIDLGSSAGMTGATLLGNDDVVLVSMAGTAYMSTDNGQSFRQLPLPRPMSYGGVVAFGGRNLALVGAEGVRSAAVEASPGLGMAGGSAVPGRGSN